MAKKPTITEISSGYMSTTAINDSLTALRDAFDNTVSRDGSTPNQMTADLDLNSNDILNAENVEVQGSLTVKGADINDLLSGTVGPATIFHTTNTFVGDGSTADFTLTKPAVSRSNVLVHVGGVYQEKNTYTVSSTTLSFSEAPKDGDKIEVIIDEATDTGVTDPGTITFPNGQTIEQAHTPVYLTRAELVTDVGSGALDHIPVGGLVYCQFAGGTLAFKKSSGATELPDLLGYLPTGMVYPDHWTENTTPGTTDMTTAIQAVVDNFKGGYLTTSTYLVSAPIISTQFLTTLVATQGFAEILCSHTSGPGIHFRKSYYRMHGVKVTPTSARAAAPYNPVNSGIMIGDFDWTDPPTGAGSSGAFGIIENCTSENHPGCGSLLLGSGGRIERCVFSGNKGHGVCVDPGTILGITSSNIGFPGWLYIGYNKIENNGGHKIAAGNPNVTAGDTVYRLHIENNDGSNNATDAAVRYVDYEGYIVGENIECLLNTWSTSGLYTAGRNIRHRLSRMVGNDTTTPIFVDEIAGYSTLGVVIEECDAHNPSAGNANPLVTLAAGISLASAVEVVQGAKTNITTLVSASDREKLTKYQFGSEVDFNDLKVGGRTVDFNANTFTPTVAFSTAGDSSFTYSVQNGYFHRISDTLAFIDLNVVFATNAYTTASGTFFVDISDSGLVLSTDSAARAGLNLSEMWNVTVAAGSFALSARTNSATTLRLTYGTTGAPNGEFGPTNFPPSTSNIAFNISGIVRLA